MTTPTAPPSLTLHRIDWGESDQREDYEVIDERGEKVGRIYRTITIGGDHAWRWTVYGVAVTNYPPVGLEPTREGAQAAFKAAWATCQPREKGA